MDTTAAAELGVGVVGPGVDGVGFWDGGTSDQNAWPEDDYDQLPDTRTPEGGGWGKGMGHRSYGRQARSLPSGSELPHKRVRSMPADMSGEGQSYGGRPGSGGYGGGSGYTGFSGPVYGGSENEAGPHGSRANPGYGGATMGGGQGGMRGTNSFSGDFSSDTRPQTPSSSGGAGSPFTAKGRGTGSIFFKTKLCTKFRAGTCPYNSNCNFAHGMEELRKPPPGWEDIVAVQDAERALRNRESPGQPILSNQGSAIPTDSQRFHKTRPCKKYYSEEGCPYGDRCNFLHDDQARARESNAISLGPTSSPSSGGGGGGGAGAGGGNNGGERPPNWKTRICNKWETTGHCPFGQKCHFAHGLTELQKYGGVHVDSDNGATSGGGPRSDAKQGGRASFKTFPDIGSSHASALYGTDGHNSTTISRHGGGVPASMQIQKQVLKTVPKWKGPSDEISTIYGDWIEEDEWEQPTLTLKPASEQTAPRLKDPSQYGQKDEKTFQGQQLKQQNSQQLNVPFFRGNAVGDMSGLRQSGQNGNSEALKDGNDRLYPSHSELSFSVDGGLEGEDGWNGEL